jgi:hypothetical protein
MPGAGFYTIQVCKLRFASDGRWYADGEPVLHERLARLLSRYLRRKANGGGYEIWIDERCHADVEVEDTPYVVTAVDNEPDGQFYIDLNDGTTELLDADSLQVSRENVLSCRVKNGGARARFLRPAYYQLTRFIEDAGNGRFQLRCGGGTHVISLL